MPPSEPDTPLAQELELRLAEARGTLTGNDELIAEFVRHHLADLAFQTAESLAQGAGVSAAAVVRFARRLGYASFRELRDRSRAERTGGAVPDSPAPESIFARKAARDIASLELLPQLLEEPLQRAAAVVGGARSAWFVANRETHGLAVYAHRLLHQARGSVGLINPAFPDPLRDLGADDALVACTFRPYARNTVELVAHARAAGVQIVLVTDGLAHDFIAAGDIVLAVPVDSPTLFLSFTPALCVLEALAALVAAQDADATYDTLEATARFLEAQRITLERPGSAPPSAPTAERNRAPGSASRPAGGAAR